MAVVCRSAHAGCEVGTRTCDVFQIDEIHYEQRNHNRAATVGSRNPGGARRTEKGGQVKSETTNRIPPSKLVLPLADRDHVQGPINAPFALVEYGDYECPYCGEAYPIVKALQERLGDRLCFAFRNFPLANAHPHAEHAAETAEAAGAQGKFWEMHD